MDLQNNELPVFPLDLVLMPSCHIPLHIFEDRYRTMVAGCLASETEFVVVWGSDTGFRQTGCAARIMDVVNRFPDGRLNILIQGTRRVSILQRRDEHPFISAFVQDAPDFPEDPDAGLVARTRDLYEDALKLTHGWPRPDVADLEHPAALSYHVIASLGLPAGTQQAMLESRSVNDRLRTAAGYLENALGALREATRRASGNGKAH